MKKRYILFLLVLIVPVMVLANSTVNLKQESKRPNSMDATKKVKIIFNSWDDCKAQGDIVKGEKLIKIAPSSEIDLNSVYTCIYAERIGDTNKFIATYEQEYFSGEVSVIFDSWDECKKQGATVKGEVLSTMNDVAKIDVEANYRMTEAHRLQETNKFVATYKLEQ